MLLGILTEIRTSKNFVIELTATYITYLTNIRSAYNISEIASRQNANTHTRNK